MGARSLDPELRPSRRVLRRLTDSARSKALSIPALARPAPRTPAPAGCCSEEIRRASILRNRGSPTIHSLRNTSGGRSSSEECCWKYRSLAVISTRDATGNRF